MDAQTARAILSEVAAGDWLDKPMPENDEELVDLAQYYVEEAQLAVKEGMNNEHLSAIINLSKVSPPVLSEPAESPNIDGGPPGEIDSSRGSATYVDPKTGGNPYPAPEELDWENAVVKEGLPLPQPIPESAVFNMPTDLTDLGDKELRRLHSAFNHYLGRARWLLAISSSNLANATHLRDESYRASYIKTLKKSQLEGEKLSQAALEMTAKDTEEYQAWAEKVNSHNKEVTSWKALVEIYGGNVDRLSREWTMRTEQYERER